MYDAWSILCRNITKLTANNEILLTHIYPNIMDVEILSFFMFVAVKDLLIKHVYQLMLT